MLKISVFRTERTVVLALQDASDHGSAEEKRVLIELSTRAASGLWPLLQAATGDDDDFEAELIYRGKMTVGRASQ